MAKRCILSVVLTALALSCAVVPLHAAPALDAGAFHSMALLTDGSVWTWGGNAYGQLGDGTQTQSLFPVHVTGALADSVAAGYYHSAMIGQDGSVWSWGQNVYGALGNGTFSPLSAVPVQAIGVSAIEALSAGSDFSVAISQAGSAQAWGYNYEGELGDGSINTLPQHGVASPVSVVLPFGVSLLDVSGKYQHSVALDSAGNVWTWGWNYYKQLGDESRGTVSAIPAQVPGLSGIAGVGAGAQHSVVLTSGGQVYAWGTNQHGQLGDGTYGLNSPSASTAVPQLVGGLSNVVAVASGLYHNLALRADGTVWAWGRNYYGQCGIGSRTLVEPYGLVSPQQVSGLTNVVAISAGFEHSLALKADGTAWAWGRNANGQVGDGSTTDVYAPVQVAWIANAGVPQASAIVCPDPVELPCGSGASLVTLTAQVSNRRGRALTVKWSVDGQLLQTDAVPANPGGTTSAAVIFESTYGTGNHVVDIAVDDGKSDTLTCSTTVSASGSSSFSLTPGEIAPLYESVADAEAAAIAATTVNGEGIALSASTEGTCAAVITVTGTDACANTATVTYNTTIDGEAPVASILGPAPDTLYKVDTAVTFSGSYTENCAIDPSSAVWRLKNAQTEITLPGLVNEATGEITLSHAFADPGVYEISLSVADAAGHQSAVDTTAPTELGEAPAIVVVYDPTAGFVTGAGLIYSPQGAYVEHPSASGYALFGFLSRYKRGASVPTGFTRFVFLTGGMDFESTSFEWMVILGSRAQYRGYGVVNGNRQCRFILTAIDGRTLPDKKDRLRLKIWDESGVIYDNQIDSGDNDPLAPSTIIALGSINIHS